MAEYAMKLTGHARKARPGVTVTHQFSPVLHGWFLGASSGIAEASDYTSGDFYGGRLQQQFGAKAFSAYTNMQPYEFMTSRCVSLHDHTSTKSDEELYLHAATTLANGGAYFFIDAINPDGRCCGRRSAFTIRCPAAWTSRKTACPCSNSLNRARIWTSATTRCSTRCSAPPHC